MLIVTLLLPVGSCSGERVPDAAWTRTADAGLPGAASSQSESQRFLAFVDAIEREMAEDSPIMAARLGYDTTGDTWDDLSQRGIDGQRIFLQETLSRLREEFDPDALTAAANLQYRILEEELELRLRRHGWRSHTYPLNQIVGLHLTVAGILTNHQTVSDEADARAYIRRLERVETLFRDLVDDMERREADGVLMPRSIYPRLIEGAEALISGVPFEASGENPVWSDFRNKLAGARLEPQVEERLLAEGRAALLGGYRYGYRHLLERLHYERRTTEIDGGVWQLPQGEDFYRFALRLFTTTEISPAEVHEMGLRHVERIHEEMRGIMARTGFEGSLPEFFDFMRQDDQFYFEDSDAGRAAYLQRARDIVAEMEGRLDELVSDAPAFEVEVKRFPPYREASSPGGFYEAPAADGSRSGSIYLNLGDMRSNPVYGLHSLLYHEGPPGHHLQISTMLADEDIPALRKNYVWWLNTAFIEGWALYAEALAAEMGMYPDDYAEFGRLSGELWRACRLVVDSGLHFKRWSRDEAIEYLGRNTSSSREANVRAVDRYLAVPGQATSFMVGMQKILEVRERAREDLGEAFDIRGFHDSILRHGNIPLWAMEAAAREWVAGEQPRR